MDVPFQGQRFGYLGPPTQRVARGLQLGRMAVQFRQRGFKACVLRGRGAQLLGFLGQPGIGHVEPAAQVVTRRLQCRRVFLDCQKGTFQSLLRTARDH